MTAAREANLLGRRSVGARGRRRTPKIPPALDEPRLRSTIGGILHRFPSIGLAVGVVRDGRLAFFHGHGLADLASGEPVTEDTVFRVGSLTKTMTAVAVMQLWERGLVDLDAPANRYLRDVELLTSQPTWRPATIRHLLTHTAGIPDALHLRDLLHFSWGPFDARPPIHSVAIGEPMPSLTEYYRGGLRIVAEPGTTFTYSNHGFAVLGQIVEDVAGMPLAAYLRENVFWPLGMTSTDLVRSERVTARLATGYVLDRRASPIVDREWIGAGGGGVYSTTRDIGRYAAALLGGGANGHGSILKPATLAAMLEPQYRPHPGVSAMGLGFFLVDAGGHRVAAHEGLMPGFNSQLLVAPDDGVALVGFTNGSRGAFSWMPDEFDRLLRELLAMPEEGVRGWIPHHPEIWPELCGRYCLPPVADLRGRIATAGGVEVLVRGGHLMLRLRLPVPALLSGLRLHPDDEVDPLVFRLDLAPLGMGTVRVAFARDAVTGIVDAMHTDLGHQPISLYRRPAGARARMAVSAGVGVAAIAAVAVARARRRDGGSRP